MNLEKRLAEALHQVDRYQPSPDLFARVNRSIEEDRAHRRRVTIGISAVALSAATLLALLLSVMRQSTSGEWTVPAWSVEIVEILVLTALLIALGPAIRRFGQPLLRDVFHLSPETGHRFARLLDVAYYLFFTGVILTDVDLDALGSELDLPGAFAPGLSRLGVFLVAMGLLHAFNLAVLPVIGLIFGSVIRWARRREAGGFAPPVSSRAARADRIATWIVVAVAIVIGGSVLLLAIWRVVVGIDIS